MADVALYGILVAVAIAVIELAYRENVRIRKRKEEIVDNIYPSLVDDINESMHNYEVHYKIRNTSFTNFLILRKLRKSQEIEKIKIVSKKTYAYLIEVENEIIPRLFKMDNRKRIVYDKIKSDWIEYVSDPSVKEINHSYGNFMNRLYTAMHRYFWDNDLSMMYTRHSEIIQLLREERPYNNIQSFSDENIEELIQIVKDNMIELKELDNEIRCLFQKVIKDKLLPQMAKNSRNTL